ncbi:MAG: hypothetical protein GX224_02730 [Thermoplasmatales archaeon]|nr:hypothetical protein [Thermoplasmatales archaeon]
MISATLRMDAGDPAAIVAAIAPETARELPRSVVSVAADGEGLVLEVLAEDVSAMRATLNSYLGCIRLAQEIEAVAGGIEWKE